MKNTLQEFVPDWSFRGKRFRNLRTKFGMEITDISRATGVPIDVIGRFETGGFVRDSRAVEKFLNKCISDRLKSKIRAILGLENN